MSQGSLWECVYNLCCTNLLRRLSSSTIGNELKKKIILSKPEIKCGLIFSCHNKLLLSETSACKLHSCAHFLSYIKS